MNTKIVLNKSCGKFTLSHKAIMRYAELSDIKTYAWITKNGYYYTSDAGGDNEIFSSYHLLKICRTDKFLVQTIEELGGKNRDDYWNSGILVVEELIPDKIWFIEDCCGVEEVKYF